MYIMKEPLETMKCDTKYIQLVSTKKIDGNIFYNSDGYFNVPFFSIYKDGYLYIMTPIYYDYKGWLFTARSDFNEYSKIYYHNSKIDNEEHEWFSIRADYSNEIENIMNESSKSIFNICYNANGHFMKDIDRFLCLKIKSNKVTRGQAANRVYLMEKFITILMNNNLKGCLSVVDEINKIKK